MSVRCAVSGESCGLLIIVHLHFSYCVHVWHGCEIGRVERPQALLGMLRRSSIVSVIFQVEAPNVIARHLSLRAIHERALSSETPAAWMRRSVWKRGGGVLMDVFIVLKQLVEIGKAGVTATEVVPEIGLESRQV